MGSRASAAVASLLIALLVSASCSDDRPELVAGAALPDEWLSSPGRAVHPIDGAAVVWVFRTSDCLSCQSIDYIVRRLYAAHGDSLPISAVHVGDPAGRALVDRFLTSRRVALNAVVTVPPREFAARFTPTALPVLLVVDDGVVGWSSAVPQGVAQLAQIDSVVAAVSATSASIH